MLGFDGEYQAGDPILKVHFDICEFVYILVFKIVVWNVFLNKLLMASFTNKQTHFK